MHCSVIQSNFAFRVGVDLHLHRVYILVLLPTHICYTLMYCFCGLARPHSAQCFSAAPAVIVPARYASYTEYVISRRSRPIHCVSSEARSTFRRSFGVQNFAFCFQNVVCISECGLIAQNNYCERHAPPYATLCKSSIYCVIHYYSLQC